MIHCQHICRRLQKSCSRELAIGCIMKIVYFCVVYMSIVSISPEEAVVSHIGGNFSFLCFSSIPSVSITSVEWLFNGTTVDANTRDVTVNFLDDFRVGVLSLSNTGIRFNNTEIRCVANLTSGQVVTSNTATLLLLQGMS